jgi:hypothetical protein
LTTEEGDEIEVAEFYRGVGIHADQPLKRIEGIVRPAIDRVFAEADPDRLLAILKNPAEPPEARVFSAAKLEAIFEQAVDERRARPSIDLEDVRGRTVGLSTRSWRDPTRYSSLLDLDGGVPRETPLPDPFAHSGSGKL